MNTKKAYIMQDEDIAKNVNQAKDLLLSFLQEEKVLTAEQAENYSKNYGFMIGKPTFFSGLWDKICKGKEGAYFMLVKITNPSALQKSIEEAPVKSGENE